MTEALTIPLQINSDRFADPEKVLTDNWPGGFYMEVRLIMDADGRVGDS